MFPSGLPSFDDDEMVGDSLLTTGKSLTVDLNYPLQINKFSTSFLSLSARTFLSHLHISKDIDVMSVNHEHSLIIHVQFNQKIVANYIFPEIHLFI